MRFVAFLRGINVGGHKPVKMDELRAAFAGMGLENVRTVQASGNVLFDAGGAGSPEPAALEELIALGLERAFGYPMGVMVRRLADLEGLVAADPFAGVPISPDARLYVTFLSAPGQNGTGIAPKRVPAGPGAPVDGGIGLVRVTEREVFTAITLAPGWGTTELMAWVEKELGRSVTTRNWNTILKLVEP